jgi:hypothetical protein
VAERLPSRLLLAPDARAAERELLAEVERAQAADPLARVVVVVPSNRLRTHVLALLVGDGRSRLGVQVLTLRALAGAIVARAGTAVGDVDVGDALFELVVARLAGGERALASALAPLEDGYAGIAATVSDLLDAGFGAEHLEEASELARLEGVALGGGAIDRGLALLRVAARLPGELAALGAALPGARFTAATEAVIGAPDAALPAARIVVHGVADTTGVAGDLLQAIFRRRPTTVLFPVPPPLDPRDGGGWRFGARLRERLEGIATPEPLGPTPPSEAGETAATFPFRSAADAERESREAIDALAVSVRAGAAPERLAIVARDLAPYRAALERGIDRRALPASGELGGEHPAAAAARAWSKLLTRGGESPLDLLLAAVGRGAFGGAPRWELRREAAERGLRHLAEIVGATPERRGTTLGRIATPLRRIVRALTALARPLELREAAAHLGRLLEASALPTAVHERLAAPLATLTRPAAGTLVVEPDELRALLVRLWSRSGERPLGGDGELADGGVALLSVTEARGLSFDRVRLVGLSRDRFPRRVRTDPFLPDPLRARLRTILPDLPVKGEGHDEERFLFAQLLVSSPRVELSAPARDEAGRELPRSSLVDEIARAGRLSGLTPTHLAPLPAAELAVVESLAAGRLGDRFRDALDEAQSRFGEPIDSAATARRARYGRALLVELSADPSDDRRRERLGPFFGFVGAVRDGDRRAAAPFVTALEAHARCGWKAFLERLLRVRRAPTIEEEIPSLPPRLAGSTLHRFLEGLAPAEIHGVALAEAARRTPLGVPWPESAGDVDARLEEAAIHVLREEGMDAELFAPALVRTARELAGSVRALDWPSGSREIVAVESEGAAAVRAGEALREVRFRADRVDRYVDEGTLVLTDYKSGRPLSTGKKAPTRGRDFARKVAEGKSLQLAAYALARLDGEAQVVGRLLFAGADVDEANREVVAAAGDAALDGAPWAAIFRARDLGAFPPRLVGTDLRTTFEGCADCEVRIACVQGDSGARLRFEHWIARASADPTEPERAARALFELHPPKRREGDAVAPGSPPAEAEA